MVLVAAPLFCLFLVAGCKKPASAAAPTALRDGRRLPLPAQILGEPECRRARDVPGRAPSPPHHAPPAPPGRAAAPCAASLARAGVPGMRKQQQAGGRRSTEEEERQVEEVPGQRRRRRRLQGAKASSCGRSAPAGGCTCTVYLGSGSPFYDVWA